MPGMEASLEIQRFEFDCKTDQYVTEGLAAGVQVPAPLQAAVTAAMRGEYRDFDMKELDWLLRVFWLNNPSYVRVAPPRRVAQTLRLLQLGQRSGGLHLDVESTRDDSGLTRVSLGLFAWTTALGIIPGTVVFAFAGQQLGSIRSVGDVLSPGVVLALVVLAAFTLLPVFTNSFRKKP